MSEPRNLPQRLDDSLFLGPPPGAEAPARAGGAGPGAPPDGPPGSAPAGHARSVRVTAGASSEPAPWWSPAARAARQRAALEAGLFPGMLRPTPRPSPPAAPADLAPAPPPATGHGWWSPARERRAEPPERPRAIRPAPVRIVRLPGTRPTRPEGTTAPRAPWWTAAGRAERARAPAASTPASPAEASGTAAAAMTSAGAEGPWWKVSPAARTRAVAPAGAAPRRTLQARPVPDLPVGRRVRVSPAPASPPAPWWSASAWEVRPSAAAKPATRFLSPRTAATPRAPADRAPGASAKSGAPPSPEDGRAPAPLLSAPLLSVRDLTVAFRGNPVVRGVTFDVMPGETVALVGESGSGKSVTALSCLRLLGPGGANPAGDIALDGVEVLTAPEAELQRLRGGVAGMVFQEPMTSLNPLHTVGRQVSEAITLHRPLRGQALRDRVLDLLRRAGLGAAAERLDAYPHQLSGGQRQRVMIAVALANDPRLLIADEPTTALDVTIQAQVLELLARLKREMRMAMLLITHDLAIVRRHADRVVVMKDGEAVEQGPVADVFANPAHPYTRLLIETQPHGRAAPVAPDTPELLRARDVKVHFPIKRGLLRRTVGHVKAVDGVSLSLRRGETLGIVGESGSGKTTLGLTLLQLERGEGTVTLDGQRIDGLSRADLRPLRRRMQIVFQDPYGSLSPRMSVGEIVGEGLAVHEPDLSRADREARVASALREVNLDPATAVRYPHEFSGGQRQRIAIARALVLSPDLVVLDEPTSALDVSVQAQVVDLLRDLQARRGLAYLFISHDLRVVRALSHRIMVMKDGRVVEEGETEAVVANPTQPYTRALMAAAFDLRASGTDDPRAAPLVEGATGRDGGTDPGAGPDVAADPAPLVPGAIPTEITSAVLPTPADTPAARAPESRP